MNELLNKSLAQIVTGNHKTASVFEKYHLDFCCKGKRTLQQACAETNLDTDVVLAELQSAADTNPEDNDPQHLSLKELSEYIVGGHHSYVKKEMPLIDGYLQKVTAKHGERHPELYKIFELFAAVREEMELHMQKEEKILFPRIAEVERMVKEDAIIQLNNTYLKAPVDMMEQEHDHAGNMLAEIRELTRDYTPPADACTTYRLCYAALRAFELDLHRHVHLENNMLFPGALKLFEGNHKIILN
jgi:regulator of cell morphogenesis and NO signaling